MHVKSRSLAIGRRQAFWVHRFILDSLDNRNLGRPPTISKAICCIHHAELVTHPTISRRDIN